VSIIHSLCFLFILLPFIWSNQVFANELSSQAGGVQLEFPQGRFQENAAPSFFKWNLQTKTSSIALKIFKCESGCSLQAPKEMVARFDFLPDVQSMNWFGEALPIGEYIWTVEAYNKFNTTPVFSDTAKFSIEPIMTYGFRTHRIGLLVGFGRGDYGSLDDNYDIKFRTTPTDYGVSYGGGSKTKIWNAKAFISDFVLRGQVYQTTTFISDFLWQLNASKANRFEVFLGPTVKYFNYPQVVSPNGTDINIKNEWVVSPGLSLKAEYELDKYIAAQMGISYDAAVFGSEKVDAQFKNGTLNTSLGLSYGKIWPVGIGAEIQYQRDRISTEMSGSGLIEINQSQWVFLLHLFYAI
jgi:hypothetical protein